MPRPGKLARTPARRFHGCAAPEVDKFPRSRAFPLVYIAPLL
jgi:hypothetical protein